MQITSNDVLNPQFWEAFGQASQLTISSSVEAPNINRERLFDPELMKTVKEMIVTEGFFKVSEKSIGLASWCKEVREAMRRL